MAELSDIIVIGAGVTGCSVAWHLHHRGLKVKVLDSQMQPATQTTGAAAGFVCHWSRINNPTWYQSEWSMQRYGIDFYRQLAERCGRNIGFYPCGIAYIALTEPGWAELQPRIADARRLGTRLENLDSQRASDLLPLVHFAATKGIVFDPDAIRIRASSAIPTLAEELADKGVHFQYDTQVTGFEWSNGHIHGVKSSKGTFHSQKVVIAAGAWSRSLLTELHVACPTEPIVQSRFVTRPLPGVDSTMPMLIFSDCHGFYIREEFGGLLIGGSDGLPVPADRIVNPEHPPVTQQIETNQAHRVRNYLHKIENIMPILRNIEENLETRQIASGLPAMTEDRFFIADKVPDCEGLYVIAACQYAGVTHGPGLGRLMTELIVDGTTSLDRTPYQLDRFSPTLLHAHR